MNESTMKAMFSSETEMWATPQNLFNRLNEEFQFNTDVCAIQDNAKCEHFFSPEINGLDQEWKGSCFMNPPYGKVIYDWLEKAYMESLKGSIVVCVIPARTDTRYFHEFCMRASEIRLVKGRLKFGDSNNSAPFPSAIIIFNKYTYRGYPIVSTYDNYTFYEPIGIPIVYYNCVSPISFI